MDLYRLERVRVINRKPGQGVLTTLELSLVGGALVRTETYVDDAGAPGASGGARHRHGVRANRSVVTSTA